MQYLFTKQMLIDYLKVMERYNLKTMAIEPADREIRSDKGKMRTKVSENGQKVSENDQKLQDSAEKTTLFDTIDHKKRHDPDGAGFIPPGNIGGIFAPEDPINKNKALTDD